MEFSLMTLGTASALPTANRYPSAHILTVHERLFLIDCGEGTQMQLRKYGMPFHKIDHIFISHLHGDHIFGIFGLLSTFSMAGRSSALHIYAPEDFSRVLEFFLSRFGEGIKYEIVHHPVCTESPVLIYEGKSVEVYAFPLRHRGETYGFLFKEKTPQKNVHKYLIGPYKLTLFEIARLKEGNAILRTVSRKDDSVVESRAVASGDIEDRNGETDGTDDYYYQLLAADDFTYLPYLPRQFAYCSDTAPFDSLAGWIKGTDLLYHEATYDSSLKDLAVTTCHSTAAEAAECAKEAGAAQLVIGHYSSRYKDLAPLLAEAKEIFPCTFLAKEGTKFEVPLKSFKKK